MFGFFLFFISEGQVKRKEMSKVLTLQYEVIGDDYDKVVRKIKNDKYDMG